MKNKESEDKKMKKIAIEFVRQNNSFEYLHGVSRDEVIAWIEKQGEQKPTEEYNITGISSKNAQGKLGEMIKNLKPVNEVLEQNPADKYKERYDFIRWFVKQMTDDYTLIPSDDDIYKWGDNILNHARNVLEQNSDWSEEDEEALSIAIFALRHPYECDGKYDRQFAIDRLKTLKERYT